MRPMKNLRRAKVIFELFYFVSAKEKFLKLLVEEKPIISSSKRAKKETNDERSGESKKKRKKEKKKKKHARESESDYNPQTPSDSMF